MAKADKSKWVLFLHKLSEEL